MGIIDRKAMENQVADHLSRLEDPEVDRNQSEAATAYHPQTNGQAKVSNREIKMILEKVVKSSRKYWATKLDDELWAYMTAYKTPIASLYARVFGKAYHLPLKLKHKALWVVKKLNFDLNTAGEVRTLQLVEIDEWRTQAYENAKIFKERANRWHDKQLCEKNLNVGQMFLLFNSELRLFPGKLKSRWSGPLIIKEVFPHGAVELINEERTHTFKVNVKRVKIYCGGDFHPKNSVDLRNLE
ncbi:uncharacterized protein LOC120067416 [Benincasa hispida]|uniref:uncharacterized protein LOC120067416 n=1 Tax=Benincasa hispida TaxID=102211 RepID=UPI001900CEB1|nr:uncharacterized protein LOC120067416 [Benincasa hispida]